MSATLLSALSQRATDAGQDAAVSSTGLMNAATGSTATVRVALSELNGRTATVEQYNAKTRTYTCSVTLPSGLEEVLELTPEDLEDIVPPRQKIAQPSVVVHRATSTSYFFPECANSRMASWWSMYQAAFSAEHAWMEARGQKTSSTLGSEPELMLDLVFREAQEPFKRQCFFAFADGSDDACGFATVDADPHPQKVCHIRMLMVDPQMQGRGVGLALIEHIVAHFRIRHLGLKYANHRSLESFYGRAGFKVIGQDRLYTYMAIKR